MSFEMFDCIERENMLSRTALILVMLLGAVPGWAQHERGEIRLQVQDEAGGTLQASIELLSEMNQIQRAVLTDRDGRYVARELPFGIYKLRVFRREFRPAEQLVKVRSEEIGRASCRERV